jgi:hypothetical protein
MLKSDEVENLDLSLTIGFVVDRVNILQLATTDKIGKSVYCGEHPQYTDSMILALSTLDKD